MSPVVGIFMESQYAEHAVVLTITIESKLKDATVNADGHVTGCGVTPVRVLGTLQVTQYIVF